MKEQTIAIFSLSQNIIIQTLETTVEPWKEVKKGVFTYLATIGLKKAIVWEAKHCTTIDMPEGLEESFVWTID